MTLKQLPIVSKNKIVCLLSQELIRNFDFLQCFEKPRELFLLAILLNKQITSISSGEGNIVTLTKKELSNDFRNITHKYSMEDVLYSIDDLKIDIDNNLFTYFEVIEDEYGDVCFSYSLNDILFSGKTITVNFASFKQFRLNSLKLSLYIMTYGSHLKFIHFSTLQGLIDVEGKSNESIRKCFTGVVSTLKKHGLISSYTFKSKEKKFYLSYSSDYEENKVKLNNLVKKSDPNIEQFFEPIEF